MVYLSTISLKIIKAYEAEKKCLQSKCRKEYNAYWNLIENLHKNKKIQITKEMRLNNAEMQAMLKCEVDHCKKVVGDLIKKLIIGLNEDIENNKISINTATTASQKKWYKDALLWNIRKLKTYKKIDIGRITWKDLHNLQA